VSTQQLRITLAGREHVVEAGTTAGAALAEAGLGEQKPGEHAVIAARVNGQFRDGTQKNGVPIADAVAEIAAAVRDRVQV
jgi:sulfur carrier protein ThiS